MLYSLLVSASNANGDRWEVALPRSREQTQRVCNTLVCGLDACTRVEEVQIRSSLDFNCQSFDQRMFL
jgi:hypothetical protein